MSNRAIKKITKILIVELYNGTASDIETNSMFSVMPICHCCKRFKLSEDELVRVDRAFELDQICKQCRFNYRQNNR